MEQKFFYSTLTILICNLFTLFFVCSPVYSQLSHTFNLQGGISIEMQSSSTRPELCTEKDAMKHILDICPDLIANLNQIKLPGKVEWELELMGGNWNWTNGVQGVYGKSTIRIKGKNRSYSFALNEGHDGIGSSQPAAAKGTINTHLAYLFIIISSLDKLSTHLDAILTDLSGYDDDIYSKVRNHLIIAASHTKTENLLNYADNSRSYLIKAIAACGLAMKGEPQALRYLKDENLFKELDMNDYREAAIERLNKFTVTDAEKNKIKSPKKGDHEKRSTDDVFIRRISLEPLENISPLLKKEKKAEILLDVIYGKIKLQYPSDQYNLQFIRPEVASDVIFTSYLSSSNIPVTDFAMFKKCVGQFHRYRFPLLLCAVPNYLPRDFNIWKGGNFWPYKVSFLSLGDFNGQVTRKHMKIYTKDKTIWNDQYDRRLTKPILLKPFKENFYQGEISSSLCKSCDDNETSLSLKFKGILINNKFKNYNIHFNTIPLKGSD